MAYTIQHTQIGAAPYWYHLECAKDLDKAIHRARNYALDNCGYVCVKDEAGNVVYGTDPVALDRARLQWHQQRLPSRNGSANGLLRSVAARLAVMRTTDAAGSRPRILLVQKMHQEAAGSKRQIFPGVGSQERLGAKEAAG